MNFEIHNRDEAIEPSASEPFRSVFDQGLGLFIDGMSMNREQVIARLREHELELKAAGILHLAVFGSVARGDNSRKSDVDLLADFDKTKHYTLLTVARIENRLADLLGTRVDLSSPEWLRESIRHQVLQEAVDAF